MSGIAAFTGHRPNKLGGYSKAAQQKLVQLAEDAIVENEWRIAIVGMALGWDQAVALACINLGVPFIAALPFEGQERIWPSEAQHLFRKILRAAQQVEVVSTSRSNVPLAMQKRNEWMVDQCDLLVTLWDGYSGGTANCVRYAHRTSKPMHHLWERYTSNLPADLWGLLG